MREPMIGRTKSKIIHPTMAHPERSFRRIMSMRAVLHNMTMGSQISSKKNTSQNVIYSPSFLLGLVSAQSPYSTYLEAMPAASSAVAGDHFVSRCGYYSSWLIEIIFLAACLVFTLLPYSPG